MPRCKQCEGKGYDDQGECNACNGTGSIEWWQTKDYKRHGKADWKEEAPDREKGYSELGLVGGVIMGIGYYFITGNSVMAVLITVISAALAATILRLFFKHILIILVIGYVLYTLFGS